ncbi:MAG: hypothetical protein R3183_05395 [Oleiphilaceae bacterium]|nr:hypothetical protein [Oleiphilaceae bacterium]
MSESSTFTFVAFDPPNIDNTSNELISSSNIEILELAKTYGADYILALQTRHVLDENLILQDHTHYGFWHIIKLGLTGFYGEGHPYIHGRIELIDARHTDESWYGKQQIKRYACYDSYFIVPFYDRAEFNLPLEAIDGEVISFSDPQELEHMYQHSKESFMKLFQYALEKCKLVPGTSLTKRYSRKTKD